MEKKSYFLRNFLAAVAGLAVVAVIYYFSFNKNEIMDGEMPEIPSGELTVEQFEQIELGMTYDQVKGIIGWSGYTSDSVFDESKTYTWDTENEDGPGTYLYTSFDGENLTYFTVDNLYEQQPDIHRITTSDALLIQKNMSYEEIEKLIGKGYCTRQYGYPGDYSFTSYHWYGENEGYVEVEFSDGLSSMITIYDLH